MALRTKYRLQLFTQVQQPQTTANRTTIYVKTGFPEVGVRLICSAHRCIANQRTTENL
jgi:hypothetical protein